jgi:hypothetical protein
MAVGSITPSLQFVMYAKYGSQKKQQSRDSISYTEDREVPLCNSVDLSIVMKIEILEETYHIPHTLCSEINWIKRQGRGLVGEEEVFT